MSDSVGCAARSAKCVAMTVNPASFVMRNPRGSESLAPPNQA